MAIIKMKKILILTAGKVEKLDAFKNKGVTLASFSDICFDLDEKAGLKLKSGEDLKSFDIIYFRFVGKSLEIATLIVHYAKRNRVQIVDKVYEKSQLIPASQSKLLELKKFNEAGIKIPKTTFGKFDNLEFPYVVKSTTGQRAREVWLVNNKKEWESLQTELDKNKLYFVQEFIPNARRIRALVIGDKVVGAILRQTKWNKDETKETLSPIPTDIVNLAIKSAKSVDLDICGVDILVSSNTKEMFVIEANAAPSWKLINRYCGVSVEDEIIKYLQKKI